MPITYAATISLLSSIQPPPPEAGFPTSDKILHATVFGLMAVFVSMAAQRPGRTFTWQGALLAIAITTGYGILNELHQSMIPGRFASAGDALADCIGAVLAVGLYYPIARKRRELSVVMGVGGPR